MWSKKMGRREEERGSERKVIMFTFQYHKIFERKNRKNYVLFYEKIVEVPLTEKVKYIPEKVLNNNNMGSAA